MSLRSTPPFRADHVGSFLRPAALLDARERHGSGAIDRDQLRAVEDAAIRDVVRFQEDLGLEGITDGEFRRTYFHIDFLEQLAGVETKGGIAVSFHSKAGNVDFAPPVMKVTGPVRHVSRSRSTTSSSCNRSRGEHPRSRSPRRRCCIFVAVAKRSAATLIPTSSFSSPMSQQPIGRK